MPDALSELQAMIASLTPEEKRELDKLIVDEVSKPWLPTPGPQSDAFFSQADVLLYGGAAGGGKTDLVIGLTLTEHQRTVIFRRQYGDLTGLTERLLEIIPSRKGWNGSHPPSLRQNGRVVEFGALDKPGSEKAWQGRPHDLICIDEASQVSEDKVSFVMGWNRSATPGQRCRVILASNPPMGGDGAWLMTWFAPWLDPLFPNPARDGELRWAINVGKEIIWCDGPEVRTIDGEEFEAKSYTFIGARLDHNPYLRDTGYRATIQNMREPMRSALLHGDFLAGRTDAANQVIPTEWVRLANERWKSAPAKTRAMICLAADVSGGGPNSDDHAIATLHEDAWFAPVVSAKGPDLKNPGEVANWMLQHRKNSCDMSVDFTGGWGSGVKSHLKRDHEIDCAPIVFSAGSLHKDRDGKFSFVNLRAEMYWKFYEALDPESGEDIMLPPDAKLMAELTAARYTIRGTKILIEDKEEIKKRVGSSPDRADAVVMAWHRRSFAVKAIERKKADKTVKPPPNLGSVAWMR